MPRKSPCPKCNSDMEEGFVVDFGHPAAFRSAWYPGVPVKGVFPIGKVKGIKRSSMPAEQRREIRSYRCRRCGFLEQYASDSE